MTEAFGVSDVLEASLLDPEKTVTEARSSFNLCFVALNEIPFWYPQWGLVVQHQVPI